MENNIEKSILNNKQIEKKYDGDTTIYAIKKLTEGVFLSGAILFIYFYFLSSIHTNYLNIGLFTILTFSVILLFLKSYRRDIRLYITDDSILYYREYLFNENIDEIKLKDIKGINPNKKLAKNGYLSLNIKDNKDETKLKHFKNPYDISDNIIKMQSGYKN